MSAIATAEVVLVLRSLGVVAEVAADLATVELGDGQRVPVMERAAPSVPGLRALIVEHTGPCLLVTNETRRSRRQILTAAGWGWLERSGHLHLPAADISQPIDGLLGAAPQVPDPWRRPRVVAVALALLRGRGAAPASRDMCYHAGISAASAATALSELRTVGMIDAQGFPDRAALSRQLAARWQPRWFGVARCPSGERLDPLITRVLQFGFDRLENPGWAHLESETSSSSESPVPGDRGPHFYVPDRRALHWALTTFSRVEPSAAVAWLAVPPTPIATWHRNPPSHPETWPWPTAEPVVLGLHLASHENARPTTRARR